MSAKNQTAALEQASVRQYCKAVRTPAIGANLLPLAEQAVKENHSHIRYLEALLALECEERDRHAVDNRIRDAQLLAAQISGLPPAEFSVIPEDPFGNYCRPDREKAIRHEASERDVFPRYSRIYTLRPNRASAVARTASFAIASVDDISCGKTALHHAPHRQHVPTGIGLENKYSMLISHQHGFQWRFVT
jgi:hypothetical protein